MNKYISLSMRSRRDPSVKCHTCIQHNELCLYRISINEFLMISAIWMFKERKSILINSATLYR